MSRKSPLVTCLEPKSYVSEAFRTMRTNIHFLGMEEKIKSLMITSSKPGEGKTTVVSNLAVTLAQAGKRVILVDCDLRKPSVHKIFFRINNTMGLTNALVEPISVAELVQRTEVTGLFILPSGPIPPNPSELINSQRMREIIDELQTMADIVLIDSPPVLAVTDASLLGALVAGVILVIKHGAIRPEEAIKVKQQLEHTNSKILGTVINGVQGSQETYYDYYQYEEEPEQKRESAQVG